MPNSLRTLLRLEQYEDPVTRQRALGTILLSVLLMVAALFQLIANVDATTARGVVVATFVTTGVLYIVCPLVIMLTRRGQQALGSRVVVSVVVVLVILVWSTVYRAFDGYIAFAMATILLGGYLISVRAVLLTTIIFVAFTFILIGPLGSTVDTQLLFSTYFPALAVQSFVSFLVAQSLGRVVADVNQQANRRRQQMEQMARAMTNQLARVRMKLDALLPEVVNSIRAMSPTISDVQLYLVERDSQNAVLMATTRTEPDAKTDSALLGQRVVIGSLSAVGRATIAGQTQVVRDTEEEQDYRRASLLPGNRACLIVPLKSGDEIIGALDLQSKSVEAFNAEEIEGLEGLAITIAIAVDSARLYSASQTELIDAQQMIDRMRTDLRDRQRETRQLIGGAWSEFLANREKTPAYSIDFQSGRIDQDTVMSANLVEASRQNRIVARSDGSSRVIAMPITVRGQAVGAMEFELPTDTNVTSEQLTLLGQLLDRVGLAAENTRLLEDAQRRAQREALIGEISAKLQSVVNVEVVTSTAAQSIADALHANRVAIRIGVPEYLSQAVNRAIPGSATSAGSGAESSDIVPALNGNGTTSEGS